VVSTPEGLRGIPEVKSSIHPIISGFSIKDFAQVVLKALELDINERMKIIENAYNLIKTLYLWKLRAEQLVLFLNEAVGR